MTRSNEDFESLYEEISAINANELIKIFSFKEDLMVLSSSMVMEGYGRYSFICFDKFASFYSKKNDFYWNNTIVDVSDPFDFISKKVDQYKALLQYY